MKVIDLMQMYVNKEILPKKIIIHDYRLYDEDSIWEHKNNTLYYREYNGDTQFLFEYIVPEMLNDEVEIIEDVPKKVKKIEDKARFQYSQIPSWFNIKEVINVVNENFEIHQQALNEIIDNINGE